MKKKYFLIVAIMFVINLPNLMAQTTFTATTNLGAWNLGTTWNQTGCSSGCVAGVDYPGAGDIAIINPTYLIQVLGSENCGELRLEDDFSFSGANAQLFIQTGQSLNVSGNVSLDEEILGGSSRITINGTGTLDVGGTMTFNSTNTNTYIRLTGAGVLNLFGDVSLSPSGFINAAGSGATVNYIGTAAQGMVGSPNAKYYNLNVSNTAGVTLLSRLPALNLLGNLNIQTGFLDNGGYKITGDAANTFTVSSGATLKLSGSSTSTLPFTILHTFPAGSTIEYAGSGQTIAVPNNSQNYDNLIVSGSASLSGNTVSVNELLTVSGTLALGTGSGELILPSTASNTASIASVTGAITGDRLTVQRYLSGDANYRTLSSPVTGQTIANWDDEIYTSGFTGSDGSAQGFVSIYTYNESVLDVVDSGWVAATNVTNPLTVGKGFFAWIQQGAPTTLSVTGAPNSGSVALSVSYSSTGSADDDGWNLVGNPFASTIAWAGVTRSGLDASAQVFNPSSGNYVLVKAAGKIAAGQGFWVHATSSPTLTVPQSAKTSPSVSGYFKQTGNDLELSLSSSINTYYDEAVISVDNASTTNYEGDFDDLKLFTPNPWEVPSLSIISNDNIDLHTNTLPELNFGDSIAIPLRVKVGITGTYTLDIDGFNNLYTNDDVVLEDLLTGTMTNVTGNSISYSFSILDTTEAPRFLLHILSNTVITEVSMFNVKSLTKVYPNPFSEATTFELDESLNTDAELKIFDQLGKVVKVKMLSKGTNNFKLNRKGISNGIYFYKIIGENDIVDQGELIIQ